MQGEATSYTLTRDYLAHPGAVAIACVDKTERILLIQQYRHPVRCRDWELPAGLLDIPGEGAHQAAVRELGEETDLQADTWHLLGEQLASPGGTSEMLRIYLARDISLLPAVKRTHREAEERGIIPRWVPLPHAYEAVLNGHIRNATAMIGIMLTEAARQRNWRGLRSVTDPLPPGCPWDRDERDKT